MKKKKTLTVKKILFVIAALILTVFFFKIKLLQGDSTAFSVKNSGYTGSALYYDTLKELGYKVGYTISPIEKLGNNKLVVLTVGSVTNNLTEDDYNKIFSYVKDGGNMLVLFADEATATIPDKSEARQILKESDGYPFNKWQFDSGGILMYGDEMLLNNSTVSMDRNTAYSILKMIHPYINKQGILFDEYYLYTNKSRSLWQEMPLSFKIIVFQLLIVVIIWVFYKGKRFGAPIKLYEELEPDENQYAKAVGSLYYQTGHWEALIDSYFNNFIQKIERKYLLYRDVDEKNWLTVFESGKGTDYKTALKIHNFMEKYREGVYNNLSKKKMKRKIKEILLLIQKLEETLK